jgi:uncharacterized protein YndB with AHSA1/START domain
MKDNAITVKTTVNTSLSKTWHYYTESEHVINWNFASADWHCPKAVNDLEVGGDFQITMAAKDGSMSFDMEGTYDKVESPKHIAYTLATGRQVTVDFSKSSAGTTVVVNFEPEAGDATDQERERWRSILDNFKKYVNNLEV